jgi:glycosyltransferase involved in cell wall biosynthesis
VIDGITGLLTEASANGLIEGVSKMLDEPGLRARLGESGQMRARRLFSSHEMIKRHEELYSQSL